MSSDLVNGDREVWQDRSLPNPLIPCYQLGRLLNCLNWHAQHAQLTGRRDHIEETRQIFNLLKAASFHLARSSHDELPSKIEAATSNWREWASSEQFAEELYAVAEEDRRGDFDAYGTFGAYEEVLQRRVFQMIDKLRSVVQGAIGYRESFAFLLGEVLDQGLRRPDVYEFMQVGDTEPLDIDEINRGPENLAELAESPGQRQEERVFPRFGPEPGEKEPLQGAQGWKVQVLGICEQLGIREEIEESVFHEDPTRDNIHDLVENADEAIRDGMLSAEVGYEEGERNDEAQRSQQSEPAVGQAPAVSTEGEAQRQRPWDPQRQKELLEIKKRIDPEDDYIGESIALLDVFGKIDRIKDRNAILLTGETGVGKTEIAKLIHRVSCWNGGYEHLQASSFLSSDPGLVRKALVGVDANSSLSNVPQKGERGYLETCEGGTLFIDEVDKVPWTVQTALLQIMDGNPMQKVGGKTMISPNVQLIYATNKNLRKLVDGKSMQHDFYDRFRRSAIPIPPLRERKDDICLFIKKFVLDQKYTIDEQAYLALWNHDWSDGNVRELKDVLDDGKEAARQNKRITLNCLDLPSAVVDSARQLDNEAAERELHRRIINALKEQGFQKDKGLQKRVGELLGMSPSTVSRRFSGLGET